VAAGVSSAESSGNFAVARYTASGILDTTFNSTGKVTTDFGGTPDAAYGVVIGPDYKITAAGYSGCCGFENFAVSRYVVSSGLEQRIYAQTDGNHNITSLANVFGSALQRYVYDPNGSATVLNPSFGVTSDAYSWVTLFQGKRFDPVTGLYNYNYREYSPTLATFMQPDPTGNPDGPDRYQMEVGNPVAFVDPLGLDVVEPDPPAPGPLHFLGNQPIPKAWGGGSMQVWGGPSRLSDYAKDGGEMWDVEIEQYREFRIPNVAPRAAWVRTGRYFGIPKKPGQCYSDAISSYQNDALTRAGGISDLTAGIIQYGSQAADLAGSINPITAIQSAISGQSVSGSHLSPTERGLLVAGVVLGGASVYAKMARAGGKPTLVIRANWGARSINDASVAYGCEKAAKSIKNLIGGQIYRIVPKSSRYLPAYRGADSLMWEFHEVVVKGGRVYDATTGAKGVTIEEFKALWDGAEFINFGF
jgi:RHS repeat-associated protein